MGEVRVRGRKSRLMIPEPLREKLQSQINQAENPREQAVNVMFEVQRHYGYLTDEGLQEAAAMVGATPLELEELATFYDFIYREPVGRFVLHVCDVEDEAAHGLPVNEVVKGGQFLQLQGRCAHHGRSFL